MSPLTGLRVLDFSHALAGPYCTMLLAQYGAEVYKIEDPAGGDVGRSWGPPFTGGEASYFLGLNAGKRSLAIDLKTPEGLARVLDLAAESDILIENMRPGTMTRLGLGYEGVRARNPRLIYCAISGYGQTGPSRDDPAMDLIVQASSGLISTTGVEGGERVRSGHSVADITAGMFAIIGIQLALEARHKTGRRAICRRFDDGWHDLRNGFELRVLFWFRHRSGADGHALCDHRSLPGLSHKGSRNRDRGGQPEAVAQLLHHDRRPELADHPDYATNDLRVKNRRVLEPLIIEIFSKKTAAEWLEIFAEHGIPCSAVRTLEEVVNDPQSTAREMFPEVGGTRITGPPIKPVSRTPGKDSGESAEAWARILMSNPASSTDYLAAERTFLAWIRTGMALIGLGFVVARFGLFLQALQVNAATPIQSTGISFWFGTALIILAAAITIGSMFRYVRVIRDLKQGASPPDRPSALAIALAALLAAIGLAMAIYLISVRQPQKEASIPMNSGIVKQLSHHSVDQTVEKIEGLLQAKGVKLFALIDHSGEAEKAGLEMRPTKLLIFGNPKGGTPLMVAAPSIAIDLPLKLLVAEDAEGKVWISYNSPQYLQSRHDLPADLVKNIAIIETLAVAAAE